MKTLFRSKWAPVFLIITVLVTVMSLRKLSDPDLGFHLKYGKYIFENHTVPTHDLSTYTVTGNPYVDLHWLFQLKIYSIYHLTGYTGLSLFVTLMTLLLMFFLLLRNRLHDIPLPVTCVVFLAGFLVLEPRLILRPELFTFLFLTILLYLLDLYYYSRRNLLFLLPVVMVVWCNGHSLFVLGFAAIVAYLVSLLVRDKKIDRKFLLWAALSVIICFVNPYLARGFSFPLELFSRFDSSNIFHQHIREFRSLYSLDGLVAKDIPFLLFFVFTVLCTLITIKKRKIHELILLVIFGYLAVVAVRNTALFAVIAMPVLGASMQELTGRFREKRYLSNAICIVVTVVSIGLIPRMITNSYYVANGSYNKTGVGLDRSQQPAGACEFINSHHLQGRLLNSIGFGGWLSWSLPQPVFNGGRLEVAGEALYQEISDSWTNGLTALISEYQPELIVYHYVKYYPWTTFLAGMPEWRLIYLDGFSAVFARGAEASAIPAISLSALARQYHVPQPDSDRDVMTILKTTPPSGFTHWLQGFWKKQDPSETEMINLASFCLQMKDPAAAEPFLLHSLKMSRGRNRVLLYPLADIYAASDRRELAQVCYQQILRMDPGNREATMALRENVQQPATAIDTIARRPGQQEAIVCFNSGNSKYRQGDYEGAFQDYSKAIELNPDYYKAYNNRGNLLSSVKEDYKAAIADFTKAIELNPTFAEAWLGRGTSRYLMADKSGACRDWKQAQSLGSPQAGKLLETYCK